MTDKIRVFLETAVEYEDGDIIAMDDEEIKEFAKNDVNQRPVNAYIAQVERVEVHED